ncbi:MAG TPA: TIGR04282 family arsenosugar biosynthesis glycosyltransferase [Verrucomicrobiales bacterium]|nr:TIGR04282 family arsenosugar biosynthesis glycosyltransferase [Verrucomicrobiales bacterium]
MDLCVVVFLRVPEAGQVKTRLAEAVGDEEAARIYRLMVGRVCRETRDVPGAVRCFCFTPPEQRAEVERWLIEDGLADRWRDRFLAQVSGDLGRRQAAALAWARMEGAEVSVLLGTDCIDVGRRHIEDAAAQVRRGRADLIFGPAEDGGYYLLAARGPHPGLFGGVRWGESSVLEDCLENAAALGLRCGLLGPLMDVDTGRDWQRVRGRLESLEGDGRDS